ncbi:hypothetical protein MKW92_022128, partial [Papaver armeniacum]
DVIRVNGDPDVHDLHTPTAATTAGYSVRQRKYAEENLSDSSSLAQSEHTAITAATAGFSVCLPEYDEENISDSDSSSLQSEEDDDISDRSLSDYHPEEYPITASESEDSEHDDDRSEMDLEKSTATTATTQSALYPNKRRKKKEEISHS